MSYSHRRRRRKATIAAFSVLLLAAVGASAQNGVQTHQHDTALAHETQPEQPTEAASAYSEAIQTLHSLVPPSAAPAPFTASTLPPSLFRYLFPNAQGPISSLVRIASKLRNQRWIPRWLSSKIVSDDPSSSSWSLFRAPSLGDSSTKARSVIELLTHAADLGHTDAMFALADISLFPPSTISTLTINTTRAFHYFRKHADLTGNATSQARTAFFHASGYSARTPSSLTQLESKSIPQSSPIAVDQARALLYYTFAAHGGHAGAAMALGYRNWAGIGLNENCGAALEWYEMAAESAMATFLSGPPGGRTLPNTATRISDLDGGAFGPGASVASTGVNAYRPIIKAAKSRGTGETWEDLVEFYQFHAERDEIEYAFRLGKIYYQGSIYNAPGGIASGADGFGALSGPDFPRAKYYFMRVARKVWPARTTQKTTPTSHLNKLPNLDESTIVQATWAAAYLGRMYLRGEGVLQNAKVARIWFERGAQENNERECLNGLGIIWRDGLVDRMVDEKKANEYFLLSAGQDLAEAQVNLGKWHYKRREFAAAMKYFEAAVRHGSPFEAFYYIASTHARRAQDPSSIPAVSAGSCGVAVSFFKLVAERGSWKDDLVGIAEQAWQRSLAEGSGFEAEKKKEDATLRWWIAAEQGLEVAQSNLAYILDQHKSLLKFPRDLPPANYSAQAALVQWTRSAAQHDVDALVKVGDYYYHGIGMDSEPQELLWEKAAGYYLSAVETQRSALAMWNLGWMYESGRGVNMDYHLAKRYYDMALDTNSEAYLPVALSLIKLYGKSLWYTLSGGRDQVLTLWGLDDKEDDDNLSTGHWYLGHMRDKFAKRWRGRKGSNPTTPDDTPSTSNNAATIDSDDPVQWASEQKGKAAEAARAEEDAYERGDFFSGDFLGAGDPRKQHYDAHGDIEEEFWETMFLVALCVMISALIYVRGRFVAQAEARRRRELQQGQGLGHFQQNGNGNGQQRGASGDSPVGLQNAGGDDRRGPIDDILPEIGLFPPGEGPDDY